MLLERVGTPSKRLLSYVDVFPVIVQGVIINVLCFSERTSSTGTSDCSTSLTGATAAVTAPSHRCTTAAREVGAAVGGRWGCEFIHELTIDMFATFSTFSTFFRYI